MVYANVLTKEINEFRQFYCENWFNLNTKENYYFVDCIFLSSVPNLLLIYVNEHSTMMLSWNY